MKRLMTITMPDGSKWGVPVEMIARNRAEHYAKEIAQQTAERMRSIPRIGAGRKGEMTPDERIDAALDSVLKASGSALRHYTMEKTLADMREAMRKVMSDAYIQGSNDNFEALKKAGHEVASA
jgi:aspartate/methionine/tyrosine aminotransferase